MIVTKFIGRELKHKFLEFVSEYDAYDYFIKTYIPQIYEIKSRCVFVLNQDGCIPL